MLGLRRYITNKKRILKIGKEEINGKTDLFISYRLEKKDAAKARSKMMGLY